MIQLDEPKTAAEVIARIKAAKKRMYPPVLPMKIQYVFPEPEPESQPEPEKKVDPILLAVPPKFIDRASPAFNRKTTMLVVAQETGISAQEILSDSRAVRLVIARSLAAYFMRRWVGSSFKQIGLFMDKDHTTAMHYVQRVQDFVTDEDLANLTQREQVRVAMSLINEKGWANNNGRRAAPEESSTATSAEALVTGPEVAT